MKIHWFNVSFAGRRNCVPSGGKKSPFQTFVNDLKNLVTNVTNELTPHLAKTISGSRSMTNSQLKRNNVYPLI